MMHASDFLRDAFLIWLRCSKALEQQSLQNKQRSAISALLGWS